MTIANNSPNTTDLAHELRQASETIMLMMAFALDEDGEPETISDATLSAASARAHQLLERANEIESGLLTIEASTGDEVAAEHPTPAARPAQDAAPHDRARLIVDDIRATVDLLAVSTGGIQIDSLHYQTLETVLSRMAGQCDQIQQLLFDIESAPA